MLPVIIFPQQHDPVVFNSSHDLRTNCSLEMCTGVRGTRCVLMFSVTFSSVIVLLQNSLCLKHERVSRTADREFMAPTLSHVQFITGLSSVLLQYSGLLKSFHNVSLCCNPFSEQVSHLCTTAASSHVDVLVPRLHFQHIFEILHSILL